MGGLDADALDVIGHMASVRTITLSHGAECTLADIAPIADRLEVLCGGWTSGDGGENDEDSPPCHMARMPLLHKYETDAGMSYQQLLCIARHMPCVRSLSVGLAGEWESKPLPPPAQPEFPCVARAHFSVGNLYEGGAFGCWADLVPNVEDRTITEAHAQFHLRLAGLASLRALEISYSTFDEYDDDMEGSNVGRFLAPVLPQLTRLALSNCFGVEGSPEDSPLHELRADVMRTATALVDLTLEDGHLMHNLRLDLASALLAVAPCCALTALRLRGMQARREAGEVTAVVAALFKCCHLPLEVLEVSVYGPRHPPAVKEALRALPALRSLLVSDD